MHHLFFFLLIISTSIFSKNYEIIENCCDLKILTPSLKNRETAKIKLTNGLIVFIVSDPDIKESAAAMAINAGSWNDPEEYPGMAHFMEHMLFQGTALYPDRNDFF
jgi:Secreted/periplasmic Zn-dependent peptidases, insulinase-like